MIFESDSLTYRNIARGLLFLDGRVLLAQDKNQGHYFPPGGGVDFGEPIESALQRELLEELGWRAEVKRFVGCLEHSWKGKKNNFETNFYFVLEVLDGDVKNPLTKESHLNFEWVELSRLTSLKIFPDNLLPQFIQQAADPQLKQPIWFSTIKQ
jgi:8-oxo-dGTP pyrophosphatase MutT (NUDIX family)